MRNEGAELQRNIRRTLARHLIAPVLALFLIPLFAWLNVGGQDFDGQFYAAGQGWVQMYDAVPLRPLQTGGYHGIFLPWAAVLTQPLSLLPLVWARAVIQGLTLAVLLALAGTRPLAWVATLVSAPALLLIFQYANLDALSAAGVLLPPAGGLLLLAAKPQAAGLAAVVWLARGRWRAFVPLGVVVVLSTLLWPEWVARVRESPAGALNVSVFPYGLVLAMPLLLYAIRRNDVVLAALITPLAVPYVAFYSLAPTIALVARRHWAWGFVAAVSSWGMLWWLMERLATLRQ